MQLITFQGNSCPSLPAPNLHRQLTPHKTNASEDRPAPTSDKSPDRRIMTALSSRLQLLDTTTTGTYVTVVAGKDIKTFSHLDSVLCCYAVRTMQ